MKKILCSLLAAVSLLSNAWAASEKLSKLGVTFTPPSGWTERHKREQKEGLTLEAFFYVSPDQDALIMVTCSEMPKEMFDNAINYWTSQFGFYDPVPIAGVQGYVFKVKSPQGAVIKQYHLYKNGKAYTIDYTEKSTEGKHLPEFEAALKSFNIS